MKKSHIAVAAMAAFAAAGTAHAQSSVTIFGIVDMALTSVDQGGKRLNSLANDGQATSRLGFRGVEDLGGGLKAEFWLEGALSPDAGTPGGVNFLRKSTVGLKGGFGEVRLGRDYTPTFWNHSSYTVFGTNGLGTSNLTYSVLGSGATTLVRADNAVSYFTPVIAGFQGQIMVGLKESTAENTPNEYTGVRLTYNKGPLSASVATATEGATVGSASSFERTNLGATYDLGMAKLWFFHVRSEFGARKNDQTAVGVTAPIWKGTFKASYLTADYNAAAGNTDATHLTLGYDYPLSKRTVVYGVYSRISNDAGASFSVAYSGGPGVGASVTSGGDSTGYAVGIRHSF